MSEKGQIKSLLQESRLFPPPEDFQSRAHISSMEQYEKLWNYAKNEPEMFWKEQAESLLHWNKPFTDVLDWQPPHAKWFADGYLNACYNCVDRHVVAGRGNTTAILWEGEPGDSKKITYSDLHIEVQKAANALKSLGLRKGDRVTIYMPMIPELTISVLACARIGVTHSVVFAGFSSEALANRNQDAGSRVVITADGVWRRGKILPLKKTVDNSLKDSPTVEKVLVVKRTEQDVSMDSDRDIWWHDLVDKQSPSCPVVEVSSEHPLFILYTSGSTGKPKGVLHTTGGYLLGATLSTKFVFDLRETDIYWCTADVGWITGHSYIVYGPLSNGATILMYEGAPNQPGPNRFWEIIEKYKVTIFYTAPTAIRTFIKWGDEHIDRHDISSLRLLGTVGEPINPEAWMWYKNKIGADRCPIVDTWWQTETGSIMITPLPGATPTTPGTATRPFFGVIPEVVNSEGDVVEDGNGGYLVISKPWPSMLRTIYGDDDRFQKTYWSQIPGKYFTGDGARRDDKGYFWIMGRVDDVINVSGHRLSTMEIESALVSHDSVAEAAVVGMPHDIKGEAISCFVTLEKGCVATDELARALKQYVVDNIGALARPEDLRFTDVLPKTRSGKIMRRLLRDVAAGRESSGDASTLEDLSVMSLLRKTEVQGSDL